jgi:hypothetical protein
LLPGVTTVPVQVDSAVTVTLAGFESGPCTKTPLQFVLFGGGGHELVHAVLPVAAIVVVE